MTYFEQYTSNTFAGSGNQLYFTMDDGERRTGRAFFKIAVSGEYAYSLLFSNILDSTYADGSVGHKNLICDSWHIHQARIGRCRHIGCDKAITETTVCDDCQAARADILVSELRPLTFGGCSSKTVMPGEFFSSDPLTCFFESGDYLCLELTFSGRMIPYHEETLLPIFLKEANGWRYAKEMPPVGMIGCDRTVKARIGYLGDSITQGVGTPINSYAHWNAQLSEKLGQDYAYWNLGIGFGRANDAASDGAWLYKAKQNDILVVCYGVNDILQGLPEEQIRSDLRTIVDTLKKAGKTVVLQTIPPFDYQGSDINKWKRLNSYIQTVLKDKVDRIFDNVPFLSEGDERSHIALYGGHPNPDGCTAWANALYDVVKPLIAAHTY